MRPALILLAAAVSATAAPPDDKALLALIRDRSKALDRVTAAPVSMDHLTALDCRAPSSPPVPTGPHKDARLHLFVSSGHHAALFDPWAKFPEGTVLLKEKLPAKDDGPPTLFTGMIKREKGFWPELGDWEFFTADGKAAAITSRGKTETCAACHTDYKDRDFVSKRITIPGDAPAPPPTQLSSGRVVLHAVRATVLGKNLRYEPPQNKNTLGFWTDPADSASWTFSIHTPGKFDVEVVQGCGKGSGDALVEVSFAPLNADKSPPPIAPLKFTVKDTGHFQNFVPRSIGTVSLPTAGLWSVTVQPRSKPGPAVMDLQSINLSPIPK